MTRSAKVLLSASGLSLAYGRRPVLQEVNLAVCSGEFWFFLGPNGEGKTTLLHAILGTLSPRSGQLRIDPELGRRDRIGFVPQRCDINPTLPTTVREFTLLGLVGVAASPDEPTNGLDLAAEDTLLRFLAGLNQQEQLTILFVTHNVALAARYATHLALFHAGAVCAGAREQVLNRQSLAQAYGVDVYISRSPAGAVAIRVGSEDTGS